MLKRQQGASLLEALVALFIVAFGLLAMAAMQIRALNETRNSAARNTAAQMASDLLDRMLLNEGARTAVNQISPYQTGWGTPANTPLDCRVSACNPNQLAQFDVWQWKLTLAQQLPAGDAQIFRSPTDPNQFGVLFRWARIAATREGSSSAASQQLFAAADEVKDGLGATGTGVATVSCAAGFTCHLAYLRP